MKTSIKLFWGIAIGIAVLASSVFAYSNAWETRYNHFWGEIVGVDEDASTTRVTSNKITLQNKRVDLLIEAIDDDERLIDDDDRYRVVAVIEEDGSYEKTVSATYKKREDARYLSTTLGRYTDSVTLFLLCDNCPTGYKFKYAGAYQRRNIVDAREYRVVLDDDYSNKKLGRQAYRSWKNFDDYKDFFDHKYRYGRYNSWGSWERRTSWNRYDDDDDRTTYKTYKSKDYDKYNWKHYPKRPDEDDEEYDYEYKHDKCSSKSCGYTPTTATPCRSTTVGCGYSKPTYTKPTVTKNYYYTNPTSQYPSGSSSSPTTKVYQCSSAGCKWVYTQG